ncbi:hypothetical protein [Streptomyces sp. NRRL S-1022]|uniref:hypothetical protein n=1 Tax=Streptomyces sp. NRRL S-1022 TaxID=1463880 RepID=UPI00131DA626|nr:hypothetical protein [Streptomyces sp. NRRL S-1022]
MPELVRGTGHPQQNAQVRVVHEGRQAYGCALPEQELHCGRGSGDGQIAENAGQHGVTDAARHADGHAKGRTAF